MTDILNSLLVKRINRTERGVVDRVTEHGVSVRMNSGVRQLPAGLIAVKPGDEVTVQGNQLTGKRRPTKGSRIYQA